MISVFFDPKDCFLSKHFVISIFYFLIRLKNRIYISLILTATPPEKGNKRFVSELKSYEKYNKYYK